MEPLQAATRVDASEIGKTYRLDGGREGNKDDAIDRSETTRFFNAKSHKSFDQLPLPEMRYYSALPEARSLVLFMLKK